MVRHQPFFYLGGGIRALVFNAGLGLWCLTPLPTIFQLCRGCQFYWWRKPEYPEKTNDLGSVRQTIYCFFSILVDFEKKPSHPLRGGKNIVSEQNNVFAISMVNVSILKQLH
jgi:hypothetical protein